jgi:hypothetical protein
VFDCRRITGVRCRDVEKARRLCSRGAQTYRPGKRTCLRRFGVGRVRMNTPRRQELPAHGTRPAHHSRASTKASKTLGALTVSRPSTNVPRLIRRGVDPIMFRAVDLVAAALNGLFEHPVSTGG